MLPIIFKNSVLSLLPWKPLQAHYVATSIRLAISNLTILLTMPAYLYC